MIAVPVAERGRIPRAKEKPSIPVTLSISVFHIALAESFAGNPIPRPMNVGMGMDFAGGVVMTVGMNQAGASE
jgi:hypothetical protein